MPITFTVYHDGQFWTGVFEREDDEGYSAARIVFGSEPKDPELYDFILKQYGSVRFSRPSAEDSRPLRKISPKRLIRMIRDDIAAKGVSTKSQEAVKREQESRKTERKEKRKCTREEMVQRKFEQKQQKRKEKKRGH